MTEETRLHRQSTALSSDIPGGCVIMDIVSGRYFSLNQTAADIWHHLKEPIPASAIAAALTEIYAIDPEICTAKVQAVLDGFLAAGLIAPDGAPQAE